MKILVLSTMYPNSVMYMPGIFVHQQVRALIELGLNITVVAPVPYTPFPFYLINKKWNNFHKVPRNEIIEGVRIHHSKYTAVHNGVLKDFWAYSYLNSAINFIKESNKELKFDLIHAHGSLPDDHAALLISRKLNIPFIVTVHGSTINQLYKKRTFYRSKQAIVFADAVIGVSEKVVSKIKEHTGRTEKLFKILNGHKSIKLNFSPEKSSNEVRIMFGGNMVESKGCEYLLKAFAILKKSANNIFLDIAGGGQLLNKMISLADKLGVTNDVFFHGSVSNEKMLHLMNECDIFVLPSFDEGFGIVYLEAMSLKKPVIATVGEGISEIIQDGVNGFLVKPKNVESIIDKLKVLIQSKELRNEIGNRGYESIKNLTWQKNALETLDVYRTILH